MKTIVYVLSLMLLITIGCKSTSQSISTEDKFSTSINDTIRIANDELEYEVIIIDHGFSNWLLSKALPRGYYSQSYLEIKNQFYVNEWNNRVLQPNQYNPNLYEMSINYDPNINYGYEVNYLIYNYMVYFQNTYKQILYGQVPPR
ncbi:MAG: hypothetical protein RLZZ44_760 [Bacteroidota bacterium]|jgi:hypothetical protein